MSNVLVMKAKILDLIALQYAGQELGLSMQQQSTYKRHSQAESVYNDDLVPEGLTAEDLLSCDYALSLPNQRSYEVGVKQCPDGSYALLFDDYAGGQGLMEAIGPKGIDLLTGYEKWAYKNAHPGAQFTESEDQEFIYITATK